VEIIKEYKKNSSGIKIGLMITVALLSIQAIIVLMRQAWAIHPLPLYVEAGALQSGRPGLLFVIVLLSLLASMSYCVVFYFAKCGLGSIVKTGPLMATAITGAGSIMAIALMWTVNLLESLETSVDYWTVAPHAQSILTFYFLGVMLMGIHCALIILTFSRVLSLGMKIALLVSVFLQTLCLAPVVVLAYFTYTKQLPKLYYWYVTSTGSFLTDAWINVPLLISASAFSVFLIYSFWSLPKNELFMPMIPTDWRLYFNKIGWFAAMLILLVSLAVTVWSPLVTLLVTVDWEVMRLSNL